MHSLIDFNKTLLTVWKNIKRRDDMEYISHMYTV